MSDHLPASAATAPRGSIHELLRQLVESRFVLTDRDGAVTRWSGPAQALFGWDPHAMLGRPLLQTLGVGAEPPSHGGRLVAEVRLRDSRRVEAELVFIPVRMSHSLEFNGFLSALEQMSADALSVERLRAGHYGVVDWIEASMAGQSQLDEDEATAGTIVTFRPLGAVELFATDAAVFSAYDDDYEPLPDRGEQLERALAGTASSVEEVREEAATARSDAAVAMVQVGELKAEGERLRGELREARALIEGLGSRLDSASGAASRELRPQLDETRALVESLRAELAEARAVEPETDALAEQLRERLAAELQGELSQLRERIEQASDAPLPADLAELRAALEGDDGEGGLRSEVERLRTRLDQTVGQELQQLRGGLEQADGLREQLAELRQLLDETPGEQFEQQLQELRDRVEQDSSEALEAQLRSLAATVERLQTELADAQAAGLAADEDRQLLGELRTELSVLRANAGEAAGRDAETLRQVLGEVEARLEEARHSAERAERAEAATQEAASLADGHAEGARAALERGSGRIEEAAARAGAHAETARALTSQAEDHARQAQTAEAGIRETSGTVEQHATRAEEAASAAAAHADLVREAGTGIEQHAVRAEQAAAEADGQAGIAEQAAQRVTDGASAAERTARNVEKHAAAAQQAAHTAGERAAAAEQAARHVEAASERAPAGQPGSTPELEARALELAEQIASRAESAASEAIARAERAEAAAATSSEALEHVARRAEEAAAATEQHLAEARAAADQAAVEAEVARVQAEAAQARSSRRPPPPVAAPSSPPPAAPTAQDSRSPLFGRKTDAGPERELRPGFDDVKQPQATIALDGHFRELNKAFSELVGYSEKDFAAATWPPVMDRQNLPKHREQLRALLAGDTDSVEVNTGYVHAQGLLVPVVGTLSLQRSDGEPSHFLLEVERP